MRLERLARQLAGDGRLAVAYGTGVLGGRKAPEAAIEDQAAPDHVDNGAGAALGRQPVVGALVHGAPDERARSGELRADVLDEVVVRVAERVERPRLRGAELLAPLLERLLERDRLPRQPHVLHIRVELLGPSLKPLV